MAYIIAEPCISVKDRSCVDVCPVDCIHPKTDEDNGQVMLYIHPEECIDCGACGSVCPVTAIFAEADTPDQWKNFIEMNADYYKMSKEEFTAKDKLSPGVRLRAADVTRDSAAFLRGVPTPRG